MYVSFHGSLSFESYVNLYAEALRTSQLLKL